MRSSLSKCARGWDVLADVRLACKYLYIHVHIGLKEHCQEFNSGVTRGSWDYDVFLYGSECSSSFIIIH